MILIITSECLGVINCITQMKLSTFAKKGQLKKEMMIDLFASIYNFLNAMDAIKIMLSTYTLQTNIK